MVVSSSIVDCGGSYVFAVHWSSVHKDKGAEEATEILMWPVDMMEPSLLKTDISELDQLYSRL